MSENRNFDRLYKQQKILGGLFMRNLKLLALGAAAIITFTGCSSSDLGKFTQYKPMQNELKNAPDWVIKPVGKYQAKASAKMIDDNFELARTEAIMTAKVRLAEKIQSAIDQEVKNKIKKKLKGKNGKVKQNLNLKSNYYVSSALIDVDEKDLWVSQNGNVWVLLQANPEIVKMAIQKAIADYSDGLVSTDE